jgi:PAS domain S-box-containing protein
LRALGLDDELLAHARTGTLETGSRVLEVDVVDLDGASLVEVRDVTERRRLEQSVRLRGDVLDHSSTLVFAKDTAGRYVLVNDEFCRRFHRSRAEVIGRTDHDLFPPEAAAAYVAHDRAVLASGRPMEAEEPLSDVLDGRWLSIKFPLRDEHGRPYAVGGISTDITDRTRAEAAKDEFLSRMSHELRTPLNAILGFGELLALEPLGPQAKGHVQHIVKAGEHLLALINEVLEITRVEGDARGVAAEPVHACEPLAEALELVAPLAQARDVVVGADLHGGLHRYLLADRRRLRQVLLNLLTNAVKYNRPGGAVRVAFRDAPGGRLRTLVVDTGDGLAADEAERAFRPFERLGAEGSDIEGTGLGLALSRSLAESMGGTVGIEHTAPGEGSAFYVELALTQASPSAPPTQEEEPDAACTLGPARILYIEDDVVNLELVRRALDRTGGGVQLQHAPRGEEGLRLAARDRPDLVLLDLGLGDLPGAEVVERLAADTRTAGIPVVVLSADATPASIERLTALGVAVYLTKPLRIGTLVDALQSTLGRA